MNMVGSLLKHCLTVDIPNIVKTLAKRAALFEKPSSIIIYGKRNTIEEYKGEMERRGVKDKKRQVNEREGREGEERESEERGRGERLMGGRVTEGKMSDGEGRGAQEVETEGEEVTCTTCTW